MIEMAPTISEMLRGTPPRGPRRATRQPSKPDRAAMPRVEPTPNVAKYARRAPIDGIVAITNAVSGPLPANPCTAPTSNGRRAIVQGMMEVESDRTRCTWEWVGIADTALADR